jgi:hypothetical protein
MDDEKVQSRTNEKKTRTYPVFVLIFTGEFVFVCAHDQSSVGTILAWRSCTVHVTQLHAKAMLDRQTKP